MHSQNHITIKLPTMQMEIVKRAAHFNGVSLEQFIIQQLDLDQFERGINESIRSASQGHLGSAELGTCTRCMESKPIGGGTDICGECALDYPDPCPKEVHDAFQNSWNHNGTHCTTCNEWLPPPSKALPASQTPATSSNAISTRNDAQMNTNSIGGPRSYYRIDFREADAYGAVWAFARDFLDRQDPELSQRLKLAMDDELTRIDSIRGDDILSIIQRLDHFIEFCNRCDDPPTFEVAEGIRFYSTWGPKAIVTIAEAVADQVEHYQRALIPSR